MESKIKLYYLNDYFLILSKKQISRKNLFNTELQIIFLVFILINLHNEGILIQVNKAIKFFKNYKNIL